MRKLLATARTREVVEEAEKERFDVMNVKT